MSDHHNSHRIGDPARNLAHLIGEAISEDVDAWEWFAPTTAALHVTRDGQRFSVLVQRLDDE